MYQYLKEITKIFQFYRDKPPSVFIDPYKSNKSGTLMSYVLRDDIGENEVAELMGYANNKMGFAHLKKYVLQKALNSVLYLNPSSIYSSPYIVNYFNCQKNVFLTKIMFTIGLFRNAEHLGVYTMRLVQKYEFWDLASILGASLSDYYATRGNAAKTTEYDDYAEEALNKLIKERKIRRFLNEMYVIFNEATIASQSVINKLENYVQKAEKICRDDTSFNSNYYLFRLRMILQQSKGNFKKGNEVCDEAINFLKNADKMFVSMRMGIMLGTKMYCYLNLRDFDNAQKLANESEEYFAIGSQNWFIINEYYYVLCLQTKNYQVAFDTLKSVLEFDGFDRQPKARIQKWEILRAYMEFVIITNIWTPTQEKDEHIHSNYKIARLLNEVSIFQRDKKGVNVSILILQILFLLQKGDFLGIIDRKDALVRYARRYLYTKENERSRVFMLHLSKMIQYGFNPLLIESKAKRLTSKMKQEFSSYTSNMGGNEILDYDMLWEWILKELKNKSSIAYNTLHKA